MKVFISSVIAGFEEYREAAARAVSALGYEAVLAEDLGAVSDTPRRACLREVREADMTVVLLGSRYGDLQESGLSATHEEFKEACAESTVLVFVQRDVDAEPAQAALIREAQDWTQGRLTVEFRTPSELTDVVTKAIHQREIQRSAGVVDSEDVYTRAEALAQRGLRTGAAAVHVAMAGFPQYEALKPAGLEDSGLAAEIQKLALFGSHPVFDTSAATQAENTESALALEQDGSLIEVDRNGGVHIALLAGQSSPLPVLIEEEVHRALLSMVRLTNEILDLVDGDHRISDVGVVAGLTGARWSGWKTAEEQSRSPNTVSIDGGGSDLIVVRAALLTYPRPALAARSDEIAHDLLVSLRMRHRAN